MKKTTEIRQSLRKAEKDISEVLRLLFIEHGSMGIEIEVKQGFYANKTDPENTTCITDVNIKATL